MRAASSDCRAEFGGGPDDGRHPVHAGETDGAQATLPGDELVPLSGSLDDDGVEQAVGADRLAQGDQRFIVELATRLLGIGVDQLRVDLDQHQRPGRLRAWGVRRGRLADRAEESVEPATEATPARPAVRWGVGRHEPTAGSDAASTAPACAGQPPVEVDGQLGVGDRPAAGGVVEVDRETVARRLAEPDVAGDERGQQLLGETAAHLVDHLVGEGEAGVEQCHDDAGDAQPGVEVSPQQGKGVSEQPEALESVELALDRHQQRLGRHRSVDREQSEAGRAVDEDVVDIVDGLDGQGEAALADGQVDHLDLRPGEAEVGGHQVEPGHHRGDAGFGDRPAGHDDVVAGDLDRARSTPRPEVALACGSMSMTRTRRPMAASAEPTLMVVVVFPTPPFWLATARTCGTTAGLSTPVKGCRSEGSYPPYPQVRRAATLPDLRSN